MSLGKFLAAGKCIMGGRGEISYRILKGEALPKFISPKNPFAPPARPETLPSPVPAPIKKMAASDEKKTQRLPVFRTAQVRKKFWLGRFNPVSLWRGKGTTAPQKTQRPMQAELSLDRVKVVHNDLSDADVEIVPIKSRMAPELPESAMSTAGGGDSWSRLSAKIFGVKAA